MELSKSTVVSLLDEAITDTNPHLSEISDERSYAQSVYYFVNTLNQSVNVQAQASYDKLFTDVFDVGAVIPVAAGEKKFETLSDRHTFIRFKVTAGIAPTSGKIIIKAAKSGV